MAPSATVSIAVILLLFAIELRLLQLGFILSDEYPPADHEQSLHLADFIESETAYES
jgi:hypothetical protein